MKPVRLFLLLSAATLSLGGCTGLGLALGAGATAGVAATQEGGVSRAISDAKIQAMINDLWFKHDFQMFSKLDMTVNQGRVLLTGVVQNPEHRVEAVRLAWQPPGVDQVINEIRVDKSSGIVGYARDAWITTRLRTSLTIDKQIQSLNYTIDTVQGTVFLMGAAQNQAELDRVIEIARTIPDVRQVVSYVKILGPDPQNAGAQPYSRADERGQIQQPIQSYVDPSRTVSYGDALSDTGYTNRNSGYEGSVSQTNNNAPIQLKPIDREAL